ncbi:acyltransferase [Mesorhizobium sp. 8]|uniref:acyltransferase family protein n=1 Tax=Mesorhizobium sp. 8 TaxID=2584466 RepID=UPI001120AAF8|nr:acyltransferase [Mesorhizobium sp. 8]QDC00872.1 acyltransferase [Mesorhizobium sp. 8]
MKRLHGIQYLRAVAALGVVVFHAAERSGTHFAIGAAGVDVFFVISGFIMWVIASERSPSPAAFLRDRIERIAPLYWIATGVMVAGALAGLFPNLRLSAWYVLSSLAFLASRSPSTGDIWPVLVQGWTLNYEMFFYALFAAALFLPARRRLAALAGLFLALAAAGWLFAPETPILKTWTDPLLLEFLVGIAIGEAWLRGAVPSPASGIVLIAVALVGFAFVGVTYAGFTPFVLGPLAAALVLGVLAFERHAAVPRLPLAAYLGDSSYSTYLWHTMAISVVAKAGSLLSLPGPVVLIAAIVAGVAIGVAVHEILEKPIAAFLKNRRRRRSGAHSMA